METSIKSLAELFYEEDFVTILRRTLDSVDSKMQADDLPFVVGALTFLGRLDEAQYLYDHRESKSSLTSRVAARFFLAIAYCRHYQGEKSRALLIANVRARHHVDELGRFYIAQGIGFYRYTYGEIRKAHRFATRAHQIAFLSKFAYGRILSLDLLAQVEIHSGSIRQGLKRYESLQDLAKEHSLHGTLVWSQISSTLHKSQYGLLGSEACKVLKDLINPGHKLDTYSQALLHLELMNQLLLRGEADSARIIMEAAQGLIFETSNPRLIAQLYLRQSAYERARGSIKEAAHFAQLAEGTLQHFHDRKLEQRIKGLLSQYGLISKEDLKRLDANYPIYLSSRILARQRKESHAYLAGQDPLGDAFDSLAKNPRDLWPTFLKNEWYGLLYELLEIPRSEDAIVLDPSDMGSLAIFSQGNVIFKAKSLTPLLRKLLMCLGEGETTKEVLLERVWGLTNYNPTRHNHLIYNLLGVARKLLDGYGDWIQSNESGYFLKDSVVLRTQRNATGEGNLNSRQLEALHKIRTQETFETKDYQNWFQISGATAARDLRELLVLNWIERSGAARSTIYRKTERTLSL